MKSKSLFQVFVLLAMLVSMFGTSQQAQAQNNPVDPPPVQVVVRSLTYWDAVYSGTVSSIRYEKWPLTLTESHHFAVTAATTNGDLTARVVLLDSNSVEISHAVGTLTSTQVAGNYYIQIQPETGSGAYDLTIREVVVVPSVSTVVDPTNILVDASAAATVNLSNVPAEGYASAEFTCTYDPSLVQVSNIADAGLFGADAAVAVNGPQNGSFIFAIAGSNDHKATAGGAVFTFSAKGLQAGTATIDCSARVSSGDNVLIDVASAGAASLVIGVAPPPVNGTLTGKVLASKPVTINLNAEGTTVTPVTANTDGTFSITAPAGTYTVVATAPGFLSAQGTATLTSENTSTMPDVSLIAGDIDGNDVIDQFDAMTIGMSYNTATPAAADLNNDATINVLDLEILASNYRASGALAWE